MSSGVDSSVAAALLLRSGHPRENLQPFYMANWSPSANPLSIVPAQLPYNKPRGSDNIRQMGSPREPEKCTERELNDVKGVCKALGLKEPLYMSFEKEYWNEVFIPMIATFQRGRTPNPDVECNRQIKFGSVIKRLKTEFEKGSLERISEGNRDWWMATGRQLFIQKHFPHL